MKKFAKRTLALLLVVCMLLGTMAMSAFAAGATAESDGSFYYDFTQTSDLDWHSYTASTDSLLLINGWGQRNLFPSAVSTSGITAAQAPILESYYENGYWKSTISEESDYAGDYTYEGRLDWLPLATSSFYNQLIAGGESSTGGSKRDWDGVAFKSTNASNQNAPGEWVALKIKAPDVGNYTVTLEYAQAKNGAKSGAVYLLPGVLTAEQIGAAIAGGTGKLGTTNFYAGSVTKGQSVQLGTVTVDTPAEEYTLVFHSETNVSGTTAANVEARMFVDGLRLTPVAQQTKVKLYDFQVRTTVDSSLNNFTEDAALLTSYYNNGTIDWDYVGCSESQAAQDRILNNNHAYIKGSGNSGWWAFKLRAPGSGEFALEMTTKTAAANKTQVWTDAYIAEYSEGMDYSTVIADSNFVGSIRPERSDAGTDTNNFVTDGFGSWHFTEGKEYILVLNINPDIYTINKDHSTVAPIGDAFMTNHLYIQSITATAVPQPVATIGETFTPPADVLYNFDLYGQNPTDYPKFDSKNSVITDLNDAAVQQKLDTWYNASENALNWDYLGTTFTGSGNYAPRVDGNYLLFSTGGSPTAKEENGQNKDNRYVALKLKSPGAGEFALEMTVHNMGATGYDAGHMWLNAYLVKLDGTTVTEENYADALATATVTGEFKPLHSEMEDGKLGTAPLLTASFDAGAEYILFLERHPDADLDKEDGNTTYSPNNIYLNAITAKSTQEATSTQEFLTVSAALEAAAETGETVKLVGPALETSVVVPDGVTLDLNGHKLTTSNFGIEAGSTGKIVDSSEGDGLLNVLADNVTFLGTASFTENTLPVYDDANTGYRFYAYTYSNAQVHADPEVEGAQRFWFQFQFTDRRAYDLMNAGNSGIELGVKVDWVEGSEDCIFKTEGSADAFIQGYANMVLNITEGKTPWLWVRVQGAEDVASLSVTPVITAGGIDVACAPITYSAN